MSKKDSASKILYDYNESKINLQTVRLRCKRLGMHDDTKARKMSRVQLIELLTNEVEDNTKDCEDEHEEAEDNTKDVEDEHEEAEDVTEEAEDVTEEAED